VKSLLPLPPRVRRLRLDPDLPPALSAALIQLVAALSAGAQAFWLSEAAGIAMTVLQLAALQGGIACMLAVLLKSDWWWRIMHLLFAPALVVGLASGLSPQLCFAALVVLVGVYWGSYRSQVPLYLSGPAAWREVARLLPPHPGARIIDLGSGLGGLTAYLGRLRPDARVDGVEAAPLPWLASQMRKRLRGWNGNLIWGDLWRVDLAGYDVAHAYLSPVPMPALWEKTCREMRVGSLLLSHSFAVPGVAPLLIRSLPGGKRLYIYRVGSRA
jgi:hypothetical protein